jgi:hypothetical protein
MEQIKSKKEKKPKKEKAPPICEDCKLHEGRKTRTEKIILCDDCVKKDEHTFITKTRALGEYFLNENDIEDVECIEIKNPHYRSQSMYLYKVSDIKDVFIKKYKQNDDDIFDELLSDLKYQKKVKKEKLEKLKEDKIEKAHKNPQKLISKKKLTKIEREILLEDKMKEKKLKIRGDSKLCQGYIDGSIKIDVDDVVERMCQVKYFYEYCDKEKYFDLARESQAEELNAGYFPDCSLFDQAEMMAIDDKGGYPANWPWLQ